MSKAPELFGNEEDTAVQRAVYRLWPVLSAHPKLCTNGRTLGFCDPSSEDVPIILELAKAFGRIGVYFTTPEVVEQVRLAAIQERLETAQGWLTLNAKTDAAKLCEGIIAQNNPQGYDLLRIANDTPGETISEFQSLQEESGVAPVPGYFMRGNAKPCVSIAATDPHGHVVSTALAIKTYHPECRYKDWVHVGYLSTRKELRGRGLSKYLLAQVIADAFERLGAHYVWTGVKHDNEPSKSVCRACGMAEVELTGMFVTNPTIVTRQFTR